MKHNPLKNLFPTILIIIFILLIYTNLGILATTNDNTPNLESKINALEERVESLSLQIISIKESNTLGPFNNPDYDSDWIPIEPGKSYTFNHGQGATPFVYIIGWDDKGENGYSIHQSCNGFDFWDTGNSTSCGIMWCCLNVNEICILRDINDTVWDEFRLLIWKVD